MESFLYGVVVASIMYTTLVVMITRVVNWIATMRFDDED
jgi:hypothetical protein